MQIAALLSQCHHGTNTKVISRVTRESRSNSSHSGVFSTANRINVHNQPKGNFGWQFRIFQTIMGMTLVNGYFAHALLPGTRMTLREYTHIVSVVMCSKVEVEVEGSPRHTGVQGSSQGVCNRANLNQSLGPIPSAIQLIRPWA